MTAVVRCPECEGLSRVASSSLGELVICPRCDSYFEAEPEEVPPKPLAEPIAPPKHDDAAEVMLAPILPASVLFGLALLPFIIPLAWIAARLLTGWEPNISLAVPISLALAAATLSLAVVSTVDWTPATRVKGVLMIVGLAYFCGAMLFFLKQDAIEWVKRNLGETLTWREVPIPRGQCSVRAPGGMTKAAKMNPLPEWKLECYRNRALTDEELTYTLAFGLWKVQPGVAEPADGPGHALQSSAGENAKDVRPAIYRGANGAHAGREWTVDLPDHATRRVVRVYEIHKTLYYLAVEGVNIESDTEEVKTFFESFRLDEDR